MGLRSSDEHYDPGAVESLKEWRALKEENEALKREVSELRAKVAAFPVVLTREQTAAVLTEMLRKHIPGFDMPEHMERFLKASAAWGSSEPNPQTIEGDVDISDYVPPEAR